MPYLDSLSVQQARRVQAHQRSLGAWRLSLGRLARGLLVLLVGAGTVAAALAADARVLWDLKTLLPPGHYLVLFQNNAEQRPSGGFLGSFATVDITPTGFENLRIDTNIYKRDNAFTERHTVQPPTPLLGVAANNKWAMRDSNWDLDFRDAAARVSWFYQQEGGEAVDGVIALNATVVQDLLRLTGPVPLPGSDEQLEAENFFDTLHYKIEKEYYFDPANRRSNEPKSILRDLVPTFLRQIMEPSVLARSVALLDQELEERQIQLYHTDPEVQARVLARGWGGALAETPGDFLLLNNASVGGRKSSLNVAQSLHLSLATVKDQLQHTLTITRTHTGDGVWPDHTNNNYLRVVVPSAASLQSVTRNSVLVTEKVETSYERDKTVYGLHLDTPPGRSSQLVLVYTTLKTSSLYYQKQSGTLQEKLQIEQAGQVFYDQIMVKDSLIPIQLD